MRHLKQFMSAKSLLWGAVLACGLALVALTSAASAADGAPSQISIIDATLVEGNSGQTEFQFVVRLDAPDAAPVTVDFSTADGTATAPGDYAANNGTVTFAPGETAKTVSVEANGDTTVEQNETFNVDLTNATGNATIADAQAIGTILNDDQLARISTVGDLSSGEGNIGQSQFAFLITLDQARSDPVTVDFSTADGTATAPDDYTASSGTLTFAPGETLKTVIVPVNADTTVEPDETFNIDLSNASANATIADAQAIGTILNDDETVIDPPALISITDTSSEEGNAGQTAVSFTVTLDQSQLVPVTVDFSTADDTATAPGDYAATTGTVTFEPDEITKTVTVQVNGDTTVEPNETFNVNLSNASGNATITDAQAVGTILNDDQTVIEAPALISITDASSPEGNSQTALSFTVRLDQAESAPVTIDFSTADDTAIAPGDYAATSGTLTFAPGEMSKTVTVQVNGDATREANETFSVNLANVTGNAAIADAQAIGTIANDDRKHAKHKHTPGGHGTTEQARH